MSVNSINKSIKFPGIANGQPNRFMMMSVEQEKATKTSQIPPQQAPQAGKFEPSKSETKGMSETSKYIIGATALAASAIAGIMFHKSISDDIAKAKDVSGGVSNACSKLAKHIKDNYLIPMEHIEDLNSSNTRVHTLYKKRKGILEKRDVSIVDAIETCSGVLQKRFVTKDGVTLANFSYGEDGKLFQYVINDREGRSVRSYISGITTKTIYTKDNEKIKIQYDGSGWTKQEKFDADGKIIETEELNLERKNKT